MYSCIVYELPNEEELFRNSITCILWALRVWCMCLWLKTTSFYLKRKSSFVSWLTFPILNIKEIGLEAKSDRWGQLWKCNKRRKGSKSWYLFCAHTPTAGDSQGKSRSFCNIWATQGWNPSEKMKEVNFDLLASRSQNKRPHGGT